MLTRSVRLAVALGCITGSSAAFALVDGQLLTGKRWYKSDDQTRAATVVQAAVHVDPIPLVPVSFGVTLTNAALEETGDMTKNTIMETGVEVTAWIPLVPFVTPYGRLNYPVTSVNKFESKDATGTSSAEAKITGPHLGVGIKYSPLPLVKLLVEGGVGMQKIKVDEFKVNGQKVDVDSDSETLDSKSLLVGIEVGI